MLDFGEDKAIRLNGRDIPNWKKQTATLVEYLNRLGDDGWEMTSAITSNNYDYGRLFFKRAKP